jgi:4-hydroxybenzoate polyprenyltransferase
MVKLSLRNKVLLPIAAVVVAVGVIAAIATSVTLNNLLDAELDNTRPLFRRRSTKNETPLW